MIYLIKFLALIVLILFVGCVSGGFRITEKAKGPFLFEGTLIDGETRNPIRGEIIEISSWYQPLFGMISYRKLGEVQTDEDGKFVFETQELDLILDVEGCTAFNHYESEPFDPREEHIFIIKKRQAGYDSTRSLRYIERVSSDNHTDF